MFEKTGCHHVVSQPVFAPIVAAVKSQLELKQFDVKVEDLTSLHEIFPEFSGKQDAVLVEPFPPTKPHHPDDIVLYIHSSGSTGLPKPVPQRQKIMLQWSSSSTFMFSVPIFSWLTLTHSGAEGIEGTGHYLGLDAAPNISHIRHIHAVLRPSDNKLSHRTVLSSGSCAASRPYPCESD